MLANIATRIAMLETRRAIAGAAAAAIVAGIACAVSVGCFSIAGVLA